MAKILQFLLFCSFLTATSALAQSAPPATPRRPVTDNYFGTSIEDPYRYLEDLQNPEVKAWFKAQNDYTRGILSGIPGREQLLKRIQALDAESVNVSSLQAVGERYFYLKQLPDANNRKLYVRDGLSGAERLLVDPEKMTENGVHYSIDYYLASLDGKQVAVGISPGGSENSVVHVYDAETGQDSGDRIHLAQFGVSAWLPNQRAFLYTRLRKLDPGEPVPNKYLKTSVYLHEVGQAQESDVKLAGYDVSNKIKMAETDVPYLAIPPNSKWAILFIGHGVQNEVTAYVAPVDAIRFADVPWKKLVDVENEVTSLDLHGDDVYLLSHHGASRYKVLHLRLPNGEISTAETLVAPSQMVLRDVKVAKDALYVPALDGGIGRLWRVPYSGLPEQIKLPVNGAIQDLFTDPRRDGVVLRIASWTTSQRYFAYDPAKKTVTDTKLIPPSPVDFSSITSEEVKVKANDGTEVPLSIVYKRGIKFDGSHPTLMHGYGSYAITYDPYFDPPSLAWLERGGVIAVAHVRGGGEYGEDWHVGGQKATKQNTISDFIACAEYLVQRKFTLPAHLAGEGTSAGGITIGGAITERPDLFAAALDNVGMSDDLRAELQVNGPLNIVEFGTVKNEEDFHNLLKISAYHRLKDQTPYPAVMLTTGVNDPRVDPWQMAKMTARLQAATSSGKPVLLRVDYDGGHGGIGATKAQHDALIADQMSFLLWQVGDPAFKAQSTSAVMKAK